MVHALHSRRVITPHGERDPAVLIVVAIKPLSALSSTIPSEDLNSLALLLGLVDAHTHINEPGRTDWEGAATAGFAHQLRTRTLHRRSPPPNRST